MGEWGMKSVLKNFSWVLICNCVLLIGSLQAKIEHSFVFIIPSYNNATWYQKNLDSIFAQNYTNYRVIYIDDCSPDQTGALVADYLVQKQQEDRVLLIRNNFRRGQLANVYDAGHLCQDHEIIIIVDGDDWLIDRNVLTYLNNVYQDPNIWMTYGQFQYFFEKHNDQRDGTNGIAAPFPKNIVENNAFRQHPPYVLTHPRTYYAWLFKQVKLQDILQNDYFYPIATDVAVMFPMIEMAGTRYKTILDPLYVYNYRNGSSEIQRATAREIRAKPPYKRLEKPIRSMSDHATISVILKDAKINDIQTKLSDLSAMKDDINIVYIKSSFNEIKQQEIINYFGQDFHITFIGATGAAEMFLSYLLHVDASKYLLMLSGQEMIALQDIKSCLDYSSRAFADCCFFVPESFAATKKELFPHIAVLDKQEIGKVPNYCSKLMLKTKLIEKVGLSQHNLMHALDNNLWSDSFNLYYRK